MMKCRGMGKMKPVTFKKGGTVKDDCYRKVKASYKVFPSAYASGAIAKCRSQIDPRLAQQTRKMDCQSHPFPELAFHLYGIPNLSRLYLRFPCVLDASISSISITILLYVRQIKQRQSTRSTVVPRFHILDYLVLS